MNDDEPRICHPGNEWTCLGCERIQCRWCDGIPGEELLCWTCHQTEDPRDVVT